jgi:hypothetical protein
LHRDRNDIAVGDLRRFRRIESEWVCFVRSVT